MSRRGAARREAGRSRTWLHSREPLPPRFDLRPSHLRPGLGETLRL